MTVTITITDREDGQVDIAVDPPIQSTQPWPPGLLSQWTAAWMVYSLDLLEKDPRTGIAKGATS